MRNTRKIDLSNCKFNFQNKNSPNTNEAKASSPNLQERLQTAEQKQKVKAIKLDLVEKLQIAKQASGITLIALVVSIVVLLILARSEHFNSFRK